VRSPAQLRLRANHRFSAANDGTIKREGWRSFYPRRVAVGWCAALAAVRFRPRAVFGLLSDRGGMALGAAYADVIRMMLRQGASSCIPQSTTALVVNAVERQRTIGRCLQTGSRGVVALFPGIAAEEIAAPARERQV
jgi:hypothetical protein